MTEVENLANNHCPPTFECEVYSIGSSYLGEDLRVLKVFRLYLIVMSLNNCNCNQLTNSLIYLKCG